MRCTCVQIRIVCYAAWRESNLPDLEGAVCYSFTRRRLLVNVVPKDGDPIGHSRMHVDPTTGWMMRTEELVPGETC